MYRAVHHFSILVASANGANAIALIVPCHRVIGATNKLVGYARKVQTFS